MRLAFLVPLLLLVPAGAAGHCTSYSTSTTDGTQIVVDTGTNAALVHYVVIDRDTGEGSLYSIWLYRETNGIAGLQRGDEMRDDTCHGLVESDGFEF